MISIWSALISGTTIGTSGGKAVCAVVGDNGALGLGVGLLQCLDLLLLHVDGAENEIDFGCDLLNIGGIQHDHLLDALGHGVVMSQWLPTASS